MIRALVNKLRGAVEEKQADRPADKRRKQRIEDKSR